MSLHPRPGYIMVLVMVVISALMMLVVPMSYRVMVHSSLMRVARDREQAKLVAQGCLALVKSRIIDGMAQSEKNTQEKDEESKKRLAFFKELNRWHEHVLKRDIDGIDATVNMYMTFEALGKIPINGLFDYKEKKYLKGDGIDGAAIMGRIAKALLAQENESEQKKFVERVEKTLAKRGRPFDDVTQLTALLTSKTYKPSDELPFLLFPEIAQKSDQQQRIALCDLVTVYDVEPAIYPPYMSPALCQALGCKPLQFHKQDQEKLLDQLKQLTKESVLWDKQWPVLLASVTGKEYTDLPQEIRTLFAPTAVPVTFACTVYATVADVTQKFYAILMYASSEPESEKKQAAQSQPAAAPKATASQKNEQSQEPYVAVIAFYWI